MLTLKKNSASLHNLVDYMIGELDVAQGDEEFLVFSREIVAQTPFDSYDQLSAILDFVRTNVRYQPDPADTELFTSPHRMMELVRAGTGAGDCDDFAIFQTAICRALGYPAKIVLLDQTGNGYNHAATEVESAALNEKFYMDATRTQRLGIASSRMRDEPGSAIDGGLTPHYVVKLEVG